MGKYLTLIYVFISFLNGGITAEEVPLTAEYRVDTMWATAYQVTVKLSNNTNQTINSWTASFTLPQGNALSGHVSGGEFFGSSSSITVKNQPSNGILHPGGSATFNMIINKSQSGKNTIDNLVALGESSDVTGLEAPILNPILSNSSKSYTLTWNKIANATNYDLEEDITSAFTNPKVISQANSNTYTVASQSTGSFYYRVAARNANEKSPYSNVQSITITGQNSEIALTAAYKVDAVWATAFQVTVTLTNKANVPVNGWTATFTLPTGFTLSSHVSSGVFSVNGQTVTVKNVSTNATIQPNGSVTFNMIINKASGSSSLINNLQALGKVNSSLPIPTAPVLTVTGTNTSYMVSWDNSAEATSYTLQESSAESFQNPKIIVEGNVLSQNFIGKPSGTYYYRVFASNANGGSAFSNTVHFTVVNDIPIPPSDTIEYSVWYLTWTSWFTGPFVIPKDVNTINIFVGKLNYDPQNKPTADGFGTFTNEQMQTFVKFLKAQNPPIQAKASIGGGGGSYDKTWDLLNANNVKAFAEGLVNFCKTFGLLGIDFDYEAFSSAEQEKLVGMLIKEFKLIDPSLQATVCCNAGFGPNFPWQQSMKNILDAAMISSEKCAVDRIYLMTYYNSMSDEINWIVGSDGKGGWANWLITNYGFTRARISVGIDDFDAHAYDPEAFKAWAINEGFSVAHWAFDPARPK